jgi:alpha-glucosidase
VVLANSVRSSARARRDRRQAAGPATVRGPGRLVRVGPLTRGGVAGAPVVGLSADFAESTLELRVVAEGLVRVSWGPGDPPLPWALNGPAAPDPPPCTVRSVDGVWRLESAGLVVELGADGGLTFTDPAGRLLRRELPPRRRGPGRTLRAPLRPGEVVAGLGEQAGRVDLRGTSHRLWNRDPGGAWGPGRDPLYLTVPVLLGLHPDGDVLVFHENPYEATVTVDGEAGPVAAPAVEVSFAGGLLRHWVAAGRLPDLLERYTGLTGRPPLPPRWALGYHHCRWGYRDSAAVRAVAQGFADEGLPLSAVHLDIDHLDGYRVFTVDPERFGDLADLCDELAARGTRVVTIVDPGVKADPSFDVFASGVAGGHFVTDPSGDVVTGAVWPGWAAFPDFTDPDARRWWAGHYRRLTDLGVAGAWHDMNEPTSISFWGDRTLPPATRHACEGRGGDHREAHNAYGLLMDRAGWEGLAAARPDRRPFVFSRSGWAGMARWSASWTGDSESTWDGLRQQVATIVGLGLSGVPFTGSDIGGFSGAPSPELYLRWLELAVFTPFCRTHSVVGVPPREPWCWPEPVRTAVGRLIRFRYRLLPYLYTLAAEAAATGHPLVRPLAWPAAAGPATDPALWSVDDAFLLGPALLVGPVAEPGAERRTVPLPAGRDWLDWRPVPSGTGPAPGTGRRRAGGTIAEVAAPPGFPAVLVAAGSVLPLDEAWAEPGPDDAGPRRGAAGPGAGAGALDDGHRPRRLAFHCFPVADGTAAGTHYDDAGDGDGPGRLDRLTLAGGRLEWSAEGEWPRPEAVEVVVHGMAVGRAAADGAPVEVTAAGSPDAPVSVVRCGSFDHLDLHPAG